MNVEAIDSATAQELIVREHYLHRKTNISHALGLFDDKELVGVVSFGTPPSRHLQISACRANPDLVIELNRLWVDDRMPRNTESWFIARALKLLPARIVVSYADTRYGHYGHMKGYARRVRRLPKARYWTVTGDRRDRKRLLGLATWPRLDWHEIPTPGETTAEENVA